VVEDALGTDVQLTLSKLSDPAATGRFQNATVPRLFDEIKRLGNEQLTQEIETHLAVFEAACKPIRARRDRLIAHNDLSTVLPDGSRARLPDPTVQEIESALAPLRKFMNAIERTFCDAETAYEHFISREDGEDLVLLLKMARRYQELQRDGSIPLDDLRKFGYTDD
jgi:hypothetical protein